MKPVSYYFPNCDTPQLLESNSKKLLKKGVCDSKKEFTSKRCLDQLTKGVILARAGIFLRKSLKYQR